MRNVGRTVCVALGALALVVAGCGGDDDGGGGGNGGGGGGADKQEALKIGHMVTGVLGQKSYFDTANDALEKVEQEFGAKLTVVQGGANNPTGWEQQMDQLSSTGQDVIVFTPVDDPDGLSAIVKKHPDQNYISYDVPVDQPNVANIVYAGAEGAYLAGVLAANVTMNTDEFKLADGSLKLGYITGFKIPVTEDFLIGFTQGAKDINPKIDVSHAFIGNFDDQTKAYNLAAAMYDDGVDVIYTEAGGAQVGVAKAAKDKDKYVIGGTVVINELHPGHTIASNLKDVEGSLYNAVSALAKGEAFKGGGEPIVYPTGERGGMRLIIDEKYVPEDVRAKIDEAAAKIKSGELKVDSKTGTVSHK
jgi:basic membrane protein A and related proteins